MKIDDLISDVAYILDCLRFTKTVGELNNCNTCLNRSCQYRPKPGESVRYNCPHYDER